MPTYDSDLPEQGVAAGTSHWVAGEARLVAKETMMDRCAFCVGQFLTAVLAVSSAVSAPVDEVQRAIRVALSGHEANLAKIKDGAGALKHEVMCAQLYFHRTQGEGRRFERRYVPEEEAPRIQTEMEFYFSGRRKMRTDVVRGTDFALTTEVGNRERVMSESTVPFLTDAAEPVAVRSWSWAEDGFKKVVVVDGGTTYVCAYSTRDPALTRVRTHRGSNIRTMSTARFFSPWVSVQAGTRLRPKLRKGKVTEFRVREDGRWHFHYSQTVRPEYPVAGQVVLDPTCGFGIAEATYTTKGRLFSQQKQHFREWAPGVWFPDRIELTVWTRGPLFEEPEPRVKKRSVWTITELQLNCDLPDETFTLAGVGIPEGTRTRNRRRK